jgi:hypothetical protein
MCVCVCIITAWYQSENHISVEYYTTITQLYSLFEDDLEAT